LDIDHHPEFIDDTAFVAPNATIVGRVKVEAEASVWFGCVLRGDNDPIVVGPRSNVQDLSMIHTDEGVPCTVGAGVTVGHRVVLHGATIGDGALIEGAIIDKNCRIGHGVQIANHRGVESTEETEQGMICDGVAVIPKDAVLPDGGKM